VSESLGMWGSEFVIVPWVEACPDLFHAFISSLAPHQRLALDNHRLRGMNLRPNQF
jgi:hypothetical protein